MKCLWCNHIIKGNVYFGFDRSFCTSNHRTNYMHKHWSLLQNYPFPYSHDLDWYPIVDEELGLQVIPEDEILSNSKDYVCINIKSQLSKRKTMIENETHADDFEEEKDKNICKYITNCIRVRSWHCLNLISQYINNLLMKTVLIKEKAIL